MSLDPEPNKQAQEVDFSRKIKIHFTLLNFNNNVVTHLFLQKHLSVYRDGRLDFREHLRNMFKLVNKTTDLLRKLQNKFISNN